MEIYFNSFFLLYILWFRITDIMDSESLMAKTRETILSSRGMHKIFVYWAHQSNFCPLHHYLESCNKFTYMSLQIYNANISACQIKFYSSFNKVIKTSSLNTFLLIFLLSHFRPIRIVENLWKHCTYLYLNIGPLFDFYSVKRMNEHLLVI